jgi:L-ascorbate metabolism protein UlaG (beta-lactamase superfamily)
MIITYQGGEFFKIQFGETTLAYNPISKESKLKGSRFGADIALISLNRPDFNGSEVLEFGDKKPFIVAGSGEYEIKGVFIKGFKSKSRYDAKEEKINTIYTLSLDAINLCFLGALSEDNIGSETTEAIDDIDILFVPIGGEGVLDPATAYKVAVKLEPKIIIPMHYSTDGSMGHKDALKIFLREAGEEKITPVDKLTIKRKDLEGKQGEVIVLTQNA